MSWRGWPDVPCDEGTRRRSAADDGWVEMLPGGVGGYLDSAKPDWLHRMLTRWLEM